MLTRSWVNACKKMITIDLRPMRLLNYFVASKRNENDEVITIPRAVYDDLLTNYRQALIVKHHMFGLVAEVRDKVQMPFEDLAELSNEVLDEVTTTIKGMK